MHVLLLPGSLSPLLALGPLIFSVHPRAYRADPVLCWVFIPPLSCWPRESEPFLALLSSCPISLPQLSHIFSHCKCVHRSLLWWRLYRWSSADGLEGPTKPSWLLQAKQSSRVRRPPSGVNRPGFPMFACIVFSVSYQPLFLYLIPACHLVICIMLLCAYLIFFVLH
jgi:hypothetical protein